ncbi:MAG: DUF433 domain-containing protein [Fibromonadaceae bacterium]|jgi:uncharacterized protein (DUF433 family)|nr:DUF433 domain-containing protein [Fibromonadaceae bacterium]
MEHFNRITYNPAVMGGKACIRGMRVTVGNILDQLGTGRSIENLLADFPYLEKEDVLEAIRYAAWRMQEKEVPFSIAI